MILIIIQDNNNLPQVKKNLLKKKIFILYSISEGYYPFVSPHRSSDTKPPPPARIPKIPPTTIHHTNSLSQYSPNGMKTSTTYLNTTQLYIAQSSPPPPPPRYPLQPPAIPPRNSPICHQMNSVTIPDFNSSASPKPINQTIYRSPIVSSTSKRNDLIDSHKLERQFNSLAINNNNNRNQYSIGQCEKCDEIITNTDDVCHIHGQIYHNSCAACVVCGRSVKNKHYFVKDQLYCEEDFLVKRLFSTTKTII